MKYCVKCGAQNADSAKFCTECGAALVVSEPVENSETFANNEPDTSYTYAEANTSEVVSDTAVEPVYSYGSTDSDKDTNADDKYTYTYNADNDTQGSRNTTYAGIAPRNIVAAIILSIVTCGIYQLFWMFKMNDEVNELSGNQLATSGGLVILFHIITCGIYGIFWSYKMGERCDEIKGSVGGSSHILYLILTLLGFGIVTFCLIQDTINKAV